MGLFSSRNRGENNSPESADESTSSGASEDGQGAKSGAWSTRSVAGRDAASDAAAPDGSRTDARDEEVEPVSPQPAAETLSTSDRETKQPSKHTSKSSQGDTSMATMGQSIVFKGELTGDEDLEIEGQVDGVVQLANHQLTIGANGRLTAEVHAKSIVVIGEVKGNLTASERIEVQATGVVTGDLKAPRLNVQEGAVLNGSIEMTGGASASASKKPAAATSSSSTSQTAPPANPAAGGAHPAA